MNLLLKSGLLIALLPWTVKGQDAGAASRYIATYSGWSYNGILDEGMSQLYYRGHGFIGGLAFERQGSRATSRINLEGHAGSLSPSGRGANAFIYRLALSYHQWQLVKKIGDFSGYIGGSFNNWLSIRNRLGYNNSEYGYDHFTALGLTGRIDRPVELAGRDLKLTGGFTLPVAALALRPSYAFPSPEKFLEDDDRRIDRTIGSSRFTTFNDLFRLHTWAGVTYPLKNGNALRLTYRWEYYSYEYFRANKLRAASHQLYFSLLFRL